jgi:hypothetical protein
MRTIINLPGGLFILTAASKYVFEKTVGFKLLLTIPKPDNQPHHPSATVFNRRLFSSSSAVPHPDDPLQHILPHSQAISDVHTNSSNRIPYRDLPSVLLSYLSDPALGSEPPWRARS